MVFDGNNEHQGNEMNTTAKDRGFSPSTPANGTDTSTQETTSLNAPQGTENLSNIGNDSKSAPPKKSKVLHKVLWGVVVLILAAAVIIYYLIFVAPYKNRLTMPSSRPIPSRWRHKLRDESCGCWWTTIKRSKQAICWWKLIHVITRPRLTFNEPISDGRAKPAPQAKAQVATDEARVEQEKANVVAAVAEAERAAADKKRYMGVGEIGVSESQIDLAVRQSRSSEAAVDAARARQLAAESQVTLDKAMVQTSAAKIQQNEASVRQAELNLSYTQVEAPASGFVTHRRVEIGSY